MIIFLIILQITIKVNILNKMLWDTDICGSLIKKNDETYSSFRLPYVLSSVQSKFQHWFTNFDKQQRKLKWINSCGGVEVLSTFVCSSSQTERVYEIWMKPLQVCTLIAIILISLKKIIIGFDSIITA